jgi:hypothetical protein
MKEDWAIGPGREAVFEHLVDRFIPPERRPDPVIAFALAVCSSYAYGDADTLARIMDRLGLTRNRCRMVCEYVDALFLTCTAYLIQSEDGRVGILCYRGTPPTSAITWMTDFQVAPVSVRFGATGPAGCVHAGFYRNVRSTRFAIAALLARAIAGRSVLDDQPVANGLQALYVTGHSLGGASAALFAASLVFEPKTYQDIRARLRAVYTYGAPMIGDPVFARTCGDDNFLRENVLRYVYANDIVPQTPPSASGRFEHFGRQYRHLPHQGPREWPESDPSTQLKSLFYAATAPASILAKMLTRLRYIRFHASLSDHFPQNYIDALTPDGLRSEFGD